MTVIIRSRSATGVACGDAVAVRPVEGVDYACPPLLLTAIRGKDTGPSGVVVQVGGIMAVYGLSMRRLTASQRLPADVQSPSEWALAACAVRRSSMRRCAVPGCVLRNLRVPIG